MSATAARPRIVVGVDGSPESRTALQWAARAAEAFGARIDVVGAWSLIMNYGWSAVPVDWSPENDTRSLVTAAVDAVFGPDKPEGLDIVLCEGHPVKALLDQSKDALMLVVGSRGHGGFTGLLLGSVSASVAEHATCPVLVVHGDGLPAVLAPAA